MHDAPIAVRDMLAKMIEEHNQAGYRREAEAAKADPLGHKLTKVMEKGMRYRYYSAGKNGRGQTVLFCWSTNPNAAGFYLGWREVYSVPRGKRRHQTVKRDMWLSRRVRRKVMQIAERRAAAFRKARAVSPIDPPLPPQD